MFKITTPCLLLFVFAALIILIAFEKFNYLILGLLQYLVFTYLATLTKVLFDQMHANDDNIEITQQEQQTLIRILAVMLFSYFC